MVLSQRRLPVVNVNKDFLPGQTSNHGRRLMTIIIASHHSADKNFKSDCHYIPNYHFQPFPKLISSHRFIEWMPSGLIPLLADLKSGRG